jgi:hypothetical protein
MEVWEAARGGGCLGWRTVLWEGWRSKQSHDEKGLGKGFELILKTTEHIEGFHISYWMEIGAHCFWRK